MTNPVRLDDMIEAIKKAHSDVLEPVGRVPERHRLSPAPIENRQVGASRGERGRLGGGREIPREKERASAEVADATGATEVRVSVDAEYAGRVGAFEGANYAPRGSWRPQIDCVMFTRDKVPFCAVCQRGIERVIDLYTAAAPTP